jgi:PRC-barrel domain
MLQYLIEVVANFGQNGIELRQDREECFRLHIHHHAFVIIKSLDNTYRALAFLSCCSRAGGTMLCWHRSRLVQQQKEFPPMSTFRPVRLLAAVTILAGAPLLSASAQTAPQTQTPPAATKPDPAPMPQTGPATRPTDPVEKPAIAPRSGDKSAASPAKVNPLVGLAVFSSDGNKLGSVHSVSAAADGKVSAIRIKTGGFLGIGGKLVAIPEGKFVKTGDNIQLGMTSDEVSKLPEVKEQS